MARLVHSVFSLPDFVKEHELAVYYFCHLMLQNKTEAEEATLQTFREFGDFFRKRPPRFSTMDIKIKLYSLAWKRIRSSGLEDRLRWLNGRDTRKINDWNKDLLTAWSKSHELTETLCKGLFNRIQLLSSEFKAPLVLKDFLAFEDEEILQILGCRWGVYRHRLHRGRLELSQSLKGNSTSTGSSL